MLCVCVCWGAGSPNLMKALRRGLTSPREGLLPTDAFPRGLQAMSAPQILDLPASRIL